MWISTVLSILAVTTLWIAAFNTVALLSLAHASRSPGRRLAARTLAAACGAQGLEAGLFLWSVGSWTPGVAGAIALVSIRGAMLASGLGVALLLLRARLRG